MRLAFVFLLLVTTAHAQQVDLVRLAYDAAQLKSNQVAMAASADGKFIAFAYENTSVKIFDIAAGKFVKRFSLPFQNLIDLHLLRLNRMAIIDNATVRIIDWKTEKELARFTLQQPASKTTYVDKLGLLAVGQFEGFVTMFDVNTLTQLNNR